jgi:hypothetical protein
MLCHPILERKSVSGCELTYTSGNPDTINPLRRTPLGSEEETISAKIVPTF